MGLTNPIFRDGVKEKYIYLSQPEDAEKIKRLEADLAKERSRPKEVKEVIKHVEKVIYQDDPGLLEKYNKAMRELGDLKLRVNKMPTSVSSVEHPIPEPITKIVFKIDKKIIAMAALLGFVGGVCISLFAR